MDTYILFRPYHPMWVRNPGPPPYGPGGVPPSSIGKPPPLNSTAFMGQHGPPRYFLLLQ